MGRNQRKHVWQCVNEPVDSGRCWFRKDDYCSVGIDEYRVCRVSGGNDGADRGALQNSSTSRSVRCLKTSDSVKGCAFNGFDDGGAEKSGL